MSDNRQFSYSGASFTDDETNPFAASESVNPFATPQAKADPVAGKSEPTAAQLEMQRKILSQRTALEAQKKAAAQQPSDPFATSAHTAQSAPPSKEEALRAAAARQQEMMRRIAAQKAAAAKAGVPGGNDASLTEQQRIAQQKLREQQQSRAQAAAENPFAAAFAPSVSAQSARTPQTAQRQAAPTQGAKPQTASAANPFATNTQPARTPQTAQRQAAPTQGAKPQTAPAANPFATNTQPARTQQAAQRQAAPTQGAKPQTAPTANPFATNSQPARTPQTAPTQSAKPQTASAANPFATNTQPTRTPQTAQRQAAPTQSAKPQNVTARDPFAANAHAAQTAQRPNTRNTAFSDSDDEVFDDFTTTIKTSRIVSGARSRKEQNEVSARASKRKGGEADFEDDGNAGKNGGSGGRGGKGNGKGSGGNGGGKKGGSKKKAGGGKRALIIIICVLLFLVLAAGTVGLLYYKGVIDLFPQADYTYSAPDYDTFMKYLKHPSLKSGDTLEVSGPITVDLETEYDGFAQLPLVNFKVSGGLEFKNGTLLFLSSSDTGSLDGITFTDCDVYVDAEKADVTWSGVIDDSKISCKTLNGTPHILDTQFNIVGAKMSIPVTLTNTSSSALQNAEVTFTSPSFIFTQGETYTVDSIPANGSVSVNVPVIAVEGGRTRILASGKDAAGNIVVSGDSGYVSIVGEGYYAGDLHTHTSASETSKRSATLEGNVSAGYDNGLSYIVSVENYESADEDSYADEQVWLAAKLEADRIAKENAAKEEAAREEAEANGETTTEGETTPEATPAEGTGTNAVTSIVRPLGEYADPLLSLPTKLVEGEEDEESSDEVELAIRTEVKEPKYPDKLTQEAVDKITGAPGEFLQLVGSETGQNSKHMLIYNSDVLPRSDYGRTFEGYGIWTYQSAIDEVVADGGIVVLPHFFNSNLVESINTAFNAYDITGLEILCNGHAIEQETGAYTTETQVELNAWNNINSYGIQRVFGIMDSNCVASEDVGTRFIKGNMGRLTEENVYENLKNGNFFASNGPEVRFTLGGAAMGSNVRVPEEGADTTAYVYASDTSPLTRVTLYCYPITGTMEDLAPEKLLDVDLTGQGVYSFSQNVDVSIKSNTFLRFEVRSEKNIKGDEPGYGFSNPIWVDDTGLGHSTIKVGDISYKYGGELKKSSSGYDYLVCENYIPMFFGFESDAVYTEIGYHKYDSNNFADTITVHMIAPDGVTLVNKTIYILDK